MVGHRLLGTSLAFAGDLVRARAHFDQAMPLYDPSEHRSFTARFSQDLGAVIFTQRSVTLWGLGYPNSARLDFERGLKHAREMGHAGTLMFALTTASYTNLCLGDCTAEIGFLDELALLAEEKAAVLWRVMEKCTRGALLTMMGNPSSAAEMLSSGISALRSGGATTWVLIWLPWLAVADAHLRKSDEAWRGISEALSLIEESNQRGLEAEVHRVAGEVLLAWATPNEKKAEKHFAYALKVAHEQQAKSWELRAAISLTRLWRDQGKVREARELLAPVYRWFTEGFDTRDLKDAKVLLQELER
jgi:predicted ATPase